MFHGMTHAIAPFLWTGAFLGLAWMRHQRKLAEIRTGQHQPSGEIEMLTSAHAREVAQLRDRVRVLERIATDQHRHEPTQSLAAQIDALRD